MASQRWVEPTEEWAELELLLEWPEQVEYERIRPAAIFGSSVAERSRQTGTPETTLRRRITSFKRPTVRRQKKPGRGPGFPHERPESPGGSGASVLLDPVHPRPGLFRLRPHPALEDLCRGGTGEKRGCLMAGTGGPYCGVRR